MRYLPFSMALTLASPAFADGADALAITGGVGANSNFIDGARTLSDSRASLTGDVQFSVPYDDNAWRLFFRTDANGVHYGNARILIRPEVGGQFSIRAVNLEISARQSLNFGDDAAGAKASDFDSSILFVRWNALSGGNKLYGEFTRTLSNPLGGAGYDTGWKLGIERSVFDPRLTLGSHAAWRHYDTANSSRYSYAKFYARYQFHPSACLMALKLIGGNAPGGQRIPDAGMVGVYYSY